MDRDLMLAVLSMDSYYGGQNLGLATKFDSDIGPAGFAAVAYSYNGETIISYRGTDGLGDVINGWSGGLGYASTQAGLAAQFYRSVVGDQNIYSTNVTFTGHSLGGGLAGLMAGLYGQEAVIFKS